MEGEKYMYKCFNAGALGIRMAWEESLPLARATGFEGIDVPLDVKRPVSQVKELLAEHGLVPGGSGLPVDFRGTQEAFERGLAALPDLAKLSAAIGQTRFMTWILPFSDTLPMKENFRLHAQRLGACARVLTAHGCRLGLEFIGPKTCRKGHKYPFVRTMEQMLDLCEAVGPNAGLLLDSWHWYTSLGTVEDILTLTNRDVVYVHINDAPAGVAVDAQQDMVRTLPGATGVEDLPGFLGALRAIGYDGPVVVEPFDRQLAALPPEEAARRAAEALARVWSAPSRHGQNG
jgi:sugar phosphate isomerase/epimerase